MLSLVAVLKLLDLIRPLVVYQLHITIFGEFSQLVLLKSVWLAECILSDLGEYIYCF